ncbi:MAG TPA: hypothetical protein VK897_14945 [Anaerolineales bacterium]|nr:hypothetical protein [Anaerolineales bacterium]
MVLLTYVEGPSQESSTLGDATEFVNVGFLAAIYLIGIFFWFVPSTLLALGLLVWSINKQVKTIVRVFALSPFILTALILLEVNLLSIVTDPAAFSSRANVRDLMSINLLTIGFTLGTGYFFVALGFGIHRLFQRLNLIKEAGVENQPVLTQAA